MKKVIYYIAVVLVTVASFGLLSSTHVGASSYVNQSDIDAYQAADKAVGEFANEARDENATLETLDEKASDAASALRNLVNHQYSTQLGAKYSEEAEILKEKASALADSIDKASSVFGQDDQGAIDAYWTTLQQQAKALEDQMMKVDEAVDVANNSTGGIYLVATIITGALVLGSFLWAFIRPQGNVNKFEAKSRRSIALASLWPFAGALITYVSFLFSDGQYMILWGLVVFGLIFYVKAVADYFTAKKNGFSEPKEKDSTPPTDPAAPIVK